MPKKGTDKNEINQILTSGVAANVLLGQMDFCCFDRTNHSHLFIKDL